VDISINKLFIYDKVYQLLYNNGNFCYNKDNGPMYRQEIKIHKGIDNTIKFRVFDPDKCPVNLNLYRINARIVNCETKQTVIEKICTRLTAKGVFSLLVKEFEIANLPEGYYKLVFLVDIVNGNNIQNNGSFYTDYTNNIELDILLTGQARRSPRPSYEIIEWTNGSTTENGPISQFWYSSEIPTGRILNTQDTQCTFSVNAENFTGYLEVYGSLLSDPVRDWEYWYKSNIGFDKNRIEFINYTGTLYFNFHESASWFKFKYWKDDSIIDNGNIKKVIVRC
jgi:hypothetical protein